MNSRLLLFLLLGAATCGRLRAADDDSAPKPSMKELLKARMAEEAKKAPVPSNPKPNTSATNPVAASSSGASSDKTDKSDPPVAPPPATETPKPGAPAAKDAAAKPASQPTTVLPKVEVKKDRITVLDQQLAKQEQDIARERKNLKASEVDTALNDAKISKPLAVFGGESTQFRQRVASERVELMEAEKDIMEAMARARTKEEKAELQKQLDQIRGFRRDLEKSLR